MHGADAAILLGVLPSPLRWLQSCNQQPLLFFHVHTALSYLFFTITTVKKTSVNTTDMKLEEITREEREHSLAWLVVLVSQFNVFLGY